MGKISFGELKISISIPGVVEAIERILTKAQDKYPDDPRMSEFEAKEQILSWISMAELKMGIAKAKNE